MMSGGCGNILITKFGWAHSSAPKLFYEALGPSLSLLCALHRATMAQKSFLRMRMGVGGHKRLFTCFMGRLLFQLLLCALSFLRREAVTLLLDNGLIGEPGNSGHGRPKGLSYLLCLMPRGYLIFTHWLFLTILPISIHTIIRKCMTEYLDYT